MRMSLVKEVTTFIGWLAGSLVGIVAILGGFGFVIHRSHMHLLGLDAFMTFETEFYVQEGGKFILMVWTLTRESLLPLLFIILLLVLPVIFLIRHAASSSRFEALTRPIQLLRDRWPWFWKTVLLIVIILPLFFHLLTRLEIYRPPLSLHHLLFEETGHLPSEHADEARTLQQWIIQRDSAQLTDAFNTLYLIFIESLVVLILVWHLIRTWPQRNLVIAPFAIMAISFLLLLPMTYGVLMKKTAFQPLKLNLRDGALLSNPSNLFFLKKTDQEFVVWDQKRKQMVWIDTREVRSAEIGRKVSPFVSTPSITEKEKRDE